MIAYATFAHSPPESLLTAVSEHAVLSLSKFEQQAIANLIWALALLHALTPSMWNQLLEAFSSVDDQQGTLFICYCAGLPQASVIHYFSNSLRAVVRSTSHARDLVEQQTGCCKYL